MNIPAIALIVASISLASTLTFALLNWRYAKRANERALAAESRAAALDARSTERSRVIWRASLCNDNYIVLSNESADFAKDIRVEYSIMLHAAQGEPDVSPFYVRSQDPSAVGKFSGVFTQVASKKQISPFEVVGLPIPPNLPFSLAGGADDGRTFGLNLHIEWFTEKGAPKQETLSQDDVIVGHSAFLWPDVRFLSFGVSLDAEAVTPLKTPDDLRREYEVGEAVDAD